MLALFHPIMRIICKPTPVGITLELEISPYYVHPEKFLLNFLPGPSWPPFPVKKMVATSPRSGALSTSSSNGSISLFLLNSVCTAKDL
jgi:hypothetical protein